MEPKKPKDGGPILRRDEHNRLDHDDATRQTDLLMKRLITEERAFQKEITFNHARGNKRDIMVYITLFARNSVNGKIILGEDESKGFVSLDATGRDPYRYKDFDFMEIPLLAKDLPMKRAQLGKALMGAFNVLVNWLARIGAVNRV